ncbi:L,D-transpeptidase [Brevundimonas sp.]|uniref:L,D-transpeptidase family protein n=1 Tax=Brevundimonas sp. TaxID=1871086 RepID=UPI0028970D24|nr:L,D-transpeptidase [Brevundimonas sp.]
MLKSRLAASAALPLALAALTACGSPVETPQSEQPPAVSTPPALTREAVETAVFEAAPPPAANGAATPATPDPAVARAQILLDRANFSPGVIDGLGGDNTRQAIAAFEKAIGLPEDGVLDAEVFRRLTAGDNGKVLANYVITAADLAGPFIGQVPSDLQAMSKLGTVGYATPLEAFAEKFHMTESLLRALNPGVDFGKAGQSIFVAAVAQTDLTAEVARIVVDKTERSVRAYDADDRLLAFYPATIGSSARPAPSGDLSVVGVAPEPNYTYDPDRVSYDRGDRKVIVPPGPNNPVGSVWIDLSRDTYGIHGTPDPSKVGKTSSSGCVRLTNWDAEQLASRVKRGVRVVFR